MPIPHPEAVRQRAITAAHQRSGQPATPTLDPRFVALNPGVLPVRERPPAEVYQWVRRDEQYATLGANVVVELYSESRARKPTTRAWAIIRRAGAATGWPANAKVAPTATTSTAPVGPIAPADLSNRGAGDGGRCPLT